MVELIVAVAILAIVGIAICAFVSFCSKNYTVSNENVKLQYDQQVCVNRVRDIVLETSRGLSFDTTTKRLLVFSDNPDATGPSDMCSVSQISLNAADNKLMIKEHVNMPDTTVISSISDLGPTSVLSDCVSAFEVDDSDIENGKVTIDITFKIDDKEVKVTTLVALRNMISKIDATSDEKLSEYYEKETTEFYSHVANVIISRDGHAFSQGKTDTIAMAGNSTTATYEAVVTKKKSYDKEIDKSVTWSLDITTLKEGYEECISIDASGHVTVKNVTNSAGVITKRPEDYMNGKYFAIVASSNEDPKVQAKLRIKVTSDGVYPVSITSSYTELKDIINGQLLYTFAHEITYTAKVKNPVDGKMVNPLKGEGAYSKISYTVTGKTADDTIPRGAGFTSTDAVNGEFLVTKSMEEHTYVITVTVNQRDAEGEAVTDVIELTIPKGAVPTKKEMTVPVIGGSETANRGMANPLYGFWTQGAPTYGGYGRYGYANDISCVYFLEWELTYDDNSCGNWNKNSKKDRTKFDDLVYLCDRNGNKLGNGKTYVSAQTARDIFVYVEPQTDWSETFTYRVNLRMKIYNPHAQRYAGDNIEQFKNNAKYFKLPSDASMEFNKITTGNKDEAYTASILVKMDKVEVMLEPTYVVFKDQQNASGKDLDSVFTTTMTVGTQKHSVGWDGDAATYYYKVFNPTFTGLSVTYLNYGKNLGLMNGWNSTGLINPTIDRSDGTSAGWLFYGNNSYDKNLFSTKTEWYGTFKVSKGYEAAFKFNEQIDNRLYLYLKMHPKDWISSQKVPRSFIWVCRICDGKGNYVTAKFTDTNSDVREYTIVNGTYNK